MTRSRRTDKQRADRRRRDRRELARENAVNQIWPLLGFRLRDKLAAD